jgi:hypothetical protein
VLRTDLCLKTLGGMKLSVWEKMFPPLQTLKNREQGRWSRLRAQIGYREAAQHSNNVSKEICAVLRARDNSTGWDDVAGRGFMLTWWRDGLVSNRDEGLALVTTMLLQHDMTQR